MKFVIALQFIYMILFVDSSAIYSIADNSPKDSLKQFIPLYYTLLDSAVGDLNKDKRPDVILVLKKVGEDTSSDVIAHPEKRPLLILIRNAKQQLVLTKSNPNTVYCFDCGGIMGDPYVGVSISDGSFTVEHYGGSAWRWTRSLTYRYNSSQKDWYLHTDVSENYHITAPDKIESKIKTVKDFGSVQFEAFDIYKEQ